MKIKMLRGLAIFLIIEIGLVHYFSSQHEFEEAWILGYLFITNFLGGLLSAYGIYRGKTWGWGLGGMIAIGSLVAYVWSRTSGLPGLPPEEWLYPWGVVSIVAESIFCLTVLLYAWWARRSSDVPAVGTNISRYLITVTALIPLFLVNYYTYQWDVRYPELSHEHVFFLWQVRLQPQVNQDTLKEEYGLEVSRAALTFRDGIVDVRMKVLDSEKADPLIEDGHFALLVGDKLIQAPHVSRHMLKNKTIIVLFPNLQNMVKSGTPVSIVFENLKVEPVSVN